MRITANQAAFCTVSCLGVATGGSVIAAATVASKTAAVAYATLAIVTTAASVAAITAWVQIRSDESLDSNASKYFATMRDHAMVTIPGAIQFVASSISKAAFEGALEGLKELIRKRVSGDDDQKKKSA